MSEGNPQIEDGYTKIANELLEALSLAQAKGIITGKERAIVDFVIRYTYGFNQKNGYFKVDYIAKKLELSNSYVRFLIHNLKKKRILIKDGGEITLNKHYEEWKMLEHSNKMLEQSNKEEMLEESNKMLEQSNIMLEPSNAPLEPSNITMPTRQEENSATGNAKENYNKENYNKENIKNINNKKTIIYNELESKNIESKDLQPKSKKEKSLSTTYSPPSPAAIINKEAVRLIMAFCELRGIEPDKGFYAKNISPATELVKRYPVEFIIAGIQWRLQDSYWNEHLTNLNTVYTHFAEWIAQAKLTAEKKTFNDWLDTHKEQDYREIHNNPDARLKAFFNAFNRALKEGVVPSPEEWKKYQEAIDLQREYLRRKE